MIQKWFYWCPECGLTEHWSFNEELDNDLPTAPFHRGCNCNTESIMWDVLRIFRPDLPEEPEKNVCYEVKDVHTVFTPLMAQALYRLDIDLIVKGR